MEKEQKSTIEEMYDILHPPEEEEVTVAACRECTLILEEMTKYCPECGTVTELGLATQALERLGDGPEKKLEDFGPFIIPGVGYDTQPGITPNSSGTTIWEIGNVTVTAGDPLNQNTNRTWEEYINGKVQA